MFGLDESEFDGYILGCGDGPASFNAKMSAQGHAVVTVDPLYAVSAAAIERRVEETFDEVTGQMRQHLDEFVLKHVPSIAELGQRRMAAMRRFRIADRSDYGDGASLLGQHDLFAAAYGPISPGEPLASFTQSELQVATRYYAPGRQWGAIRRIALD